ncbi:MAG: metallophosphoesterase family protein [Coriobacteriia bacterium]|nr:metallophosphoesterase family protein [Coriobacteriia bacterium]MCL2871358.1 metallophosphoesterase family protein [Coriobacteriia bacterium]
MRSIRQIIQDAPELHLKGDDKLVIFSDLHKGDGNIDDRFSLNRNNYLHALRHYWDEGYLYIELGDGDELWKVRDYSLIKNRYPEIMRLRVKFQTTGRFHEFAGNHDLEKLDANWRAENNYFNNDILEGMHLHYGSHPFLLIHGHQADFFDSTIWKVMRWVNYYPDRLLQLLGMADFTKAAKNYAKRNFIERKLIKWARENSATIIAGHTHKPTLSPEEGYINSGSGMHPNGVTCLEFEEGFIRLCLWQESVQDNGDLCIKKSTIKSIKLG